MTRPASGRGPQRIRDKAEIVPIERGRAKSRQASASVEDQLRQRVRELERRVADLEGDALAGEELEGAVVALARLVHDVRGRLDWENVARLWSVLYFSWHSEDTDEFGYDARFADRVRPLFEFLYTVWWRVEAHGVDAVPHTGPALIVANHSGVLPWDGAMMKLALRHEHPARRESRLLALDMFALFPFLAPFLARTGEVRANPENGERLLRQGEVVGVFPEGVKGVGKRFENRYQLARFGRGGFVRLALRTGAPIVPCAIVGAEEIHPVLAKADWVGNLIGLPYFPITPTWPHLGPLGLVPLPTKWTIEFADPISVDEYGAGAADDPILVNRLKERVRARIQDMVATRLARRRSIWFG